MNTLLRLLLGAALVAGGAIGALAGDEDTFLSEQAIVRLLPGADVQSFNTTHGTTTLVSIASRDIYLLKLPFGVDEQLFQTTLEIDPMTVWAELNYENESPEGRAANFFVSGPPDSNSTYAEQYAHAKLALGPAHRWSVGQGITVGLVDTGVDATHPELVGRIVSGWNFVEDNANTDDLGNGADDDGDGDTDEMVGHGTHIAGIIAMVAPQATILAIRALEGDGGGDAFDVARAIFFAIDANVDVLNLSLGSTYEAQVVVDAVDEADLAGITIVAAAGNMNRETPEEYPAREGDVIGVVSVGEGDVKSPFSNFGSDLEISAPGESILSTIPGGGYATWSGTSMATGLVSGAAALVVAARPKAEVDNALTRTAVPIDDLNPAFAGLLGDGRVDVGRGLFSSEVIRVDRAAAPGLWTGAGLEMDASVQALALHQSDLVAGGRFADAAGVPAAAVARWDGAGWAPLGAGLDGEVQALASDGVKLYAGGFFRDSGGTPVSRVAAWNGSAWQALGTAMNNGVYALAVFQADLVAGGSFTTADGAPASHVARWNGSAWVPLGVGTNDTVLALTVHDGSLYAGGWFTTAGGAPAGHVARWDGASWHPLGSGVDDAVTTITVHESALVVGGRFRTAGPLSVRYVAGWDGAAWSSLGAGLPASVLSLTSHGNLLFAGGVFHSPPPTQPQLQCVASWNGAAWQNLGDGVDAAVLALEVRQGALFAGGYLSMAGGISASHLASFDLTTTTGIDVVGAGGETAFQLLPGRPNPFTNGTTLAFELAREEEVELTVHDVTGRRVRRLVSDRMSSGHHDVRWSGANDAGEALASGVYFVRLRVGGGSRVQKTLLIRP